MCKEILIIAVRSQADSNCFNVLCNLTLKAYCQFWVNFWQLKASKNDEKCFLFHLKNIINPYNFINSQFFVVLDGIFCFSARFCDNSLLVFKMRFQVFSFPSKKVQGFSSDRKILMLLLSVLFHLQNRVSVFWNFNF